MQSCYWSTCVQRSLSIGRGENKGFLLAERVTENKCWRVIGRDETNWHLCVLVMGQ